MKVSVVMPVYRPKKVWPLFEKSIKGILNQDYDDFEFIAVIDGEDLKIAKYIESVYSRKNIKIFMTKKTNGPAVSMNLGASKSSGKFLIFHDQDDFSEPNRISVLVDEIEKRNTKIVASSFHEDFYDGFVLSKSKVVEKHKGSILGRPDLINIMRVPFHFPTAIINKDFFFEIGGFEPMLAQDVILCIKSCLFGELIYGCSVPVINNPLFHWCRNNQSISNSGSGAKIIEKNRRRALANIIKEKDRILVCRDRDSLIKMLQIKDNLKGLDKIPLVVV